MKNDELSQLTTHWSYVAKFLGGYPKNDEELDKLIGKLDELLEVVGENENHELIGLVNAISNIIEEYESLRYQTLQEKSTGIDALKFLMESHNLNQSDLPEIGSQGVVSEILSGKRQLNLGQIQKLSKKFGVDPSTFITDDSESKYLPPINHGPKSASG